MRGVRGALRRRNQRVGLLFRVGRRSARDHTIRLKREASRKLRVDAVRRVGQRHAEEHGHVLRDRHVAVVLHGGGGVCEGCRRHMNQHRSGNYFEIGSVRLLPREDHAEVTSGREEVDLNGDVANSAERHSVRGAYHLSRTLPAIEHADAIDVHAHAVAALHLHLVVAGHVNAEIAAPFHIEAVEDLAGNARPAGAAAHQRMIDVRIDRVGEEREGLLLETILVARALLLLDLVVLGGQSGERRTADGEVNHSRCGAQGTRCRHRIVSVHRRRRHTANHARHAVQSQSRGEVRTHSEARYVRASEHRAISFHRSAHDGPDVAHLQEGGRLAAHERRLLVHSSLGQPRLRGAVGELQTSIAAVVGVVETHEVSAGGEMNRFRDAAERARLAFDVDQGRQRIIEEDHTVVVCRQSEVVRGRHADVDKAGDRSGEHFLNRIVQTGPLVSILAEVVILQVQRLKNGTRR